MARAYISGPISLGDTATAEDIERNKESFRMTARYLENAGDVPLSPLVNEGVGKTWNEYMRLDIALLMTADKIVMLPGWEHSRGARIEHDLAVALDMQVIE